MTKSLGALRPVVEMGAEQWMGERLSDDVNKRCFMLLGYDILFDENHNFGLCEINSIVYQYLNFYKKLPDGTTYIE